MRLLRGLAGALLWILAAVLGLLGIVLSITIILAPIGIPLFLLSRRLFGRAVRLMLPASVAHPAKELGKSGRKSLRRGRRGMPDLDVGDAKKRTRKFVKRQRKRLG